MIPNEAWALNAEAGLVGLLFLAGFIAIVAIIGFIINKII